MAETMVVFFLDSLVKGAGPGIRGGDFARFLPGYDGIHPHRASRGAYEIMTSDWIKRGRPTEIMISVPDEVKTDG